VSANLFSRDWYRIAELKPRLRPHISVHAHRYRGKRWYVLEDHITGQVRRLSPESYLIVGLMNGKRSVDRLWDLASQRLGAEMPTHEELLQLLASLYQANLIRMDISGDIGELFERGKEAQRRQWISKLKSPLSIKIPLLDPEKFLCATQQYVRPLLSRSFLVIWCLLVAYALVLVGEHWDELTRNVSDRVLAADNLLLLWLIYPVIKLIHELGHGYCIKRGGGEVHELGIMLLVLIPMPYVDASASAAFADKKQRMLVGAAGILVELFIASLAMLVWVNAEAGLAKSIAYNVMFIAGVSTVLVNGNPLLRFDGYYILADFLEIPNLGQRANRYWAWLAKRVLFGVKGHASPAYDRRESLWLFGYGVSALVYRLFLMVTIVLFVAQQYFVIGVVLAIWSLLGTFIWPNLKMLVTTWRDSTVRSGSRSPALVIPLCIALVVLLLGFLRLPLSTTIEGVVQIADDRRVLVRENCFISEIHQSSGMPVSANELLVSCDNPRLRTEKEVLQHQYAEALAQLQGVWDDPVQIKIYNEELARLQSEIAENQLRLDALKLYAGADGTWIIDRASDLPGRFVSRGDLLGYVITDQQVEVRGMIPEADIDFVRARIDRVHALKAADLYGELEPASWHIFPAATREPVSEILSEAGGGAIVMDPSTSPPETVQQYFVISILFDRLPQTRVEERVFLQFEHPPEALVYRGFRLVRRTFLKYFDV
jgi:putative peptide zinc metalloprotease protein